ncbi:hypothetical protein M164_1010 [Sulfolobus islandicus M.16.4]|uniref:Uncharacterized protein n=1 Tax=Saccharolobus islandicus (strain M.16.4 / Kamchatka \|nr:hypothetical protein M164_1010 [Sulfolobus islandicus M.16.4]
MDGIKVKIADEGTRSKINEENVEAETLQYKDKILTLKIY